MKERDKMKPVQPHQAAILKALVATAIVVERKTAADKATVFRTADGMFMPICAVA